MKIEVYDSFERLPPTLASLCTCSVQDNWFHSLEWMQCLYRTVLASTVTPHIYVVLDDTGAAVGCLFCCVRQDDRRELCSMTTYYALAFAPVFRAGADIRGVSEALAQHIASERPRWHTLRWDTLDLSHAGTAALIDALARHGFAITRHHQYENWYVDIGGVTFAQYFEKRPSRMRNTVERKSKKLAKTHQTKIVVVQQEGPELESAMADWVAIYNSSWKQPEPYPEFMPEHARTCARLGLLRLGVLYVDGTPAAAQFWITLRGLACIYKLAYDERFSDWSVGSILSHHLFRHAIDIDGIAVADYGVGSEPYKKDWMDSMRQLEGMRAYSMRTLRGATRILDEKLRQRAKRFVRRAPAAAS